MRNTSLGKSPADGEGFGSGAEDPCGVIIANPDNARANYFYHLQAWKKLRVNQADVPPGSKNVVFGYDKENGQDDPQAVTSSGGSADPATLR